MVRFAFASILAIAAAVGQVTAAPAASLPKHVVRQGDSAIGEEVGVSAINGVVQSNTSELASQTGAKETTTATTAEATMTHTPTTTTVEVSVTAHVTATLEKPADTTVQMQHTTTSSAYGSGYTNWGGSGYDSCVQQCLATYGGAPVATYTAPAPTGTATPTQNGASATHTIIVAPTKGVLRMVPFAVNASVGDTVKFIWGAGPHTVTKGSALQICNATLDGGFTSGRQNASFTFEQVVNTTEPTFYFCGVAKHCAMGMFGIINPPTVPVGSNSSAASLMASMVQTNPDVAAMWSYSNNKAQGTSAAEWASTMDTSVIPPEAHQAFVENIMYDRTVFAANTGMLERGLGASDADGTGVQIPVDITQALAVQNSASASATATGTSPATPSATSVSNNAAEDSSKSSSPSSSDARSLASSTALVGLVAVVISFLAL